MALLRSYGVGYGHRSVMGKGRGDRMECRGELERMVAPLLVWYEKNKKELPWRTEATPYHIWLSEIMLQQTRTTAVIPYYERFICELPFVSALAEVPDDALMKLWEGLGYYSRARNLKKAARILMENYGGHLPDTAEALRALPGIGDYTAGAIASIAFGRPEPAVDGNVLRTVMRFTGCEDDIAAPATKKRVAEALREIYPSGREAGIFTQAIMELGENVCIPNGAPKCGACPLREMCEARISGRTETIPVKSPKKARRTEECTVLLLSCRGKYAIRRRQESGLLAGLWEFPNVTGHMSASDAANYIRGLVMETLSCEPCGDAVHIFTHVEWHMTGYLAECVAMAENLTWECAETILSRYAIPTAFRAYVDVMVRDAEA